MSNIRSIEYSILPFNFRRLPQRRLLLVNPSGEFSFVSSDDFNDLLNHNLTPLKPVYFEFKSKHFLADTDLDISQEMVATQLRSRKSFLRHFTSLHMIVVTARCNFICDYCHASSASLEQQRVDMTWQVAKKTVDLIFSSPSPVLKIEFQGGEPLLNWPIIKAIVQYSKFLNRFAKRQLEFVICTNLTLLTDEMIAFIKKHELIISTSLDGPKHIQDCHRKTREGFSGYDAFRKNLQRLREAIGSEASSALLTITRTSLSKLPEVIDHYLELGFDGVFLRALNPYGFAQQNMAKLGYSMEEFVVAYKHILRYLIDLNLQGTPFTEYYTTLLLQRIFTPFSTGFVDLQSPSGAAISGVIYDFNGEVYPTDEARMLARTGEKHFRMGHVLKNSYEEIFAGDLVKELVKKSCIEVLPGCASCVFQAYCGVDPVRNYVETKDIVGHRPSSDFCKKNTLILEHLFQLIDENDPDVMDVFWSWITRRPLEEVRHDSFKWERN
ncbi:His-Xaa-Ser system radical SAM maturase HxsB [Sporomusa acidovorans]|uniref:His-Xaa-Ser system radical SAM maturase HxsB n=1 Tax=Sporomusa acidovorans TaxID=112900 RepID=UPI00088829E0|nr:His-Xaa-Ser system radical SAM maturase HxsB [Sporomusa acidovorans]OZC18954.1 anaerobic sulfatase-maturating enzyme [Sporomusa acidovorans DSM 3132]SDD70515.1 His-Xaa-Ser system radical SAM maturase HxsB [Sporomusa acidovorans]